MELTVEYDRLAEWIADVKRIIDIEVHDRGRNKCVGLLFGQLLVAVPALTLQCHWQAMHCQPLLIDSDMCCHAC